MWRRPGRPRVHFDTAVRFEIFGKAAPTANPTFLTNRSLRHAGARTSCLRQARQQGDVAVTDPLSNSSSLRSQDPLDCVVIGGGPAGLTAATYLGRFRRKVLVVDAGKSRAAQIPESHNHPGFAGIAGTALLEALRRQARRYGVRLRHGEVAALERRGDHFAVTLAGAGAEIHAARVLLATGLTDTSPALPNHDDAVRRAVIRYCPICDGFEATDANVAVYGTMSAAHGKALFLRTYTQRVTILARDGAGAPAEAARAGIAVARSAPVRLWQSDRGIEVELRSGETLAFDAVYPALGCEVHSGLARDLGARCTDVGCVQVDGHQQSSVEGLYAAGDVVSDLHQLSVAEGHAAIAATAIHNGLPRNFR
jgi:thioredoxin reductase (NADPH)